MSRFLPDSIYCRWDSYNCNFMTLPRANKDVLFFLLIHQEHSEVAAGIEGNGSGFRRDSGVHRNGFALGSVKPGPSAISTTVPPSPTFHSKHCIIAPTVDWTSCKAKEAPGQPLLPLPNGISSKCCPLTSMASPPFFSMNRSG